MFRIPQPSFSSGELLLDKFRIDGFIGTQDGWEVYEATSTHKVIVRMARMHRIDRYLSFLLDARRIIQLRHLNLVPMLAEGLIGDHVVVVSDLAPGESLATLLRGEGAVPWPAAVKITAGVLAGLTALHEVGVVHRLLTPASVIVSGGHTPVARIWDTTLGYVRARAAVSAVPELELGDRPKTRHDIYAAGLLLYRLLSGSAPFGDASLAAVRRRASAGGPVSERIPPPAVPAHRPPPPQPIIDVALAALSPDPAHDRPGTAEEFADRLRPFL